MAHTIQEQATCFFPFAFIFAGASLASHELRGLEARNLSSISYEAIAHSLSPCQQALRLSMSWQALAI